MSEDFALRASFAPASSELRPFLTRFAGALEEGDFEALRTLLHAAKLPDNSKFTEGQAAGAYAPASEYAHFKQPLGEKLLGALEDAQPVLRVSGKQKISIQMSGTDNGTADACALFLTMLGALGAADLAAAGKGYTWKAKWSGAAGALSIRDYTALEEGIEIDPKAAEKKNKRQIAENRRFLQSSLGFLAGAIEEDCGRSLPEFVRTISADGVLGKKYSQILTLLGKVEESSGASYHGGDFELMFWHGHNELKLEIAWRDAKLPGKRLTDQLRDSGIDFINRPDRHVFPDFEWAVKDWAVRAAISDGSFTLTLSRLPWAAKLPPDQRLKVFAAPPCRIGAVYWKNLYQEIEAGAAAGDAQSKQHLSWLKSRSVPGISLKR